MKIVAAKSDLFRIPLARTVVDAAHGEQSDFELVTVRLTDADGVEGLGITYTGGHGGRSIRAALEERLLRSVVGADGDLTEAIWSSMWQAMHYEGQGGVVVFAMSAIDIALWDLKAKRANLPLWRLLAGAKREVRPYAGGIDLNFTIDELLEQSRTFRERGFRAIKMKVGRPHLREDIERVAAMRRELGDDFPLMVDANMGWSVGEAIAAARALRDFGLVWIEEPIEPRNFSGHARVADQGVSIAAGENLRTLGEFKQLIEAGQVNYPEPDVTNCGGITTFIKIARMAEAFERTITSHGLHDLTVHLHAAFPRTDFLEIHGYSLDAYLEYPLRIENGLIKVPERIGHGVDLLWDSLQPFAM